MKVNCPDCNRRIKIRKNTRKNFCKCGHYFENKNYWKVQDVYLVDANIMIYAIKNDKYRGEHSRNVLLCFNIGTTIQAIKEVKCYNEYSDTIKIYYTKISDEVKNISSNTSKTPSLQDKSLIQCAIDNPEICGIVTNDPDIKNLVPSYLIKSSTNFFIGRPNELLKKHNKF